MILFIASLSSNASYNTLLGLCRLPLLCEVRFNITIIAMFKSRNFFTSWTWTRMLHFCIQKKNTYNLIRICISLYMPYSITSSIITGARTELLSEQRTSNKSKLMCGWMEEWVDFTETTCWRWQRTNEFAFALHHNNIVMPTFFLSKIHITAIWYQ